MTVEIDENMPPLDDVETEAVTPEVEAEQGEAIEAESSPAKQEAPAEHNGVQERINKITADKYAEKRRADELEAKLKELSQSKPESIEVGAEPTLEQFDYDESKFQQALIDHRVKKGLSEFELKQQEQVEQAKANQERARMAGLQAQYLEKVEKFKETAPDFQEKISGLPEFNDQTFEAILTSDNGPKLAYYLADNLDVADQIVTATPVQAGMILGRIEDTLSTVKQSNNSKAPDPVETASSGGVINKDLADMSMEEIYNMG